MFANCGTQSPPHASPGSVAQLGQRQTRRGMRRSRGDPVPGGPGELHEGLMGSPTGPTG